MKLMNTRRHAQNVPGFWLHPTEGCFPLSPTEHHRDFLLQNLALFGASEDLRELKLVGIYQRGWVSIRKFEPPHDQWHVVYGQVNTALPTLAQWAEILLTDVPDESSALVVFTSVSEHAAAARSMQELAAGRYRFCFELGIKYSSCYFYCRTAKDCLQQQCQKGEPQMGLSYLGGKQWWEITRDERFFCSHLYHLIRERGVAAFVEILNERGKLCLDSTAAWEIAYEVCFYRDLSKHQKTSGAEHVSPYSLKRTFDLALFSETAIVIIEAKAQQCYDPGQVATFKTDVQEVTDATGVQNVVLVALASSKAPRGEFDTSCFGDRYVTWKQIAEMYDDDPILHRADEIYEESNASSFGRNNTNGSMAGLQLVAAHRRNEQFSVGRKGGLTGKEFAEDLRTGEWETRKYETNSATTAPNPNWFLLSDFVEAVTRERTSS